MVLSFSFFKFYVRFDVPCLVVLHRTIKVINTVNVNFILCIFNRLLFRQRVSIDLSHLQVIHHHKNEKETIVFNVLIFPLS